jgi:integrase
MVDKFSKALHKGGKWLGSTKRKQSGRKWRTIKTRVDTLRQLIDYCGKPLSKITQQDVDSLMNHIGEIREDGTYNNHVRSLKLFFRWPGWTGDNLAEDLVEKHGNGNKLPLDNLLTQDDIKALVSVTTKQRDRALIMLFWDSGARLGELMGLKIKHITFDNFGGVVFVNGKTGQRRIRLIDSVPDLKLWLDQHPDRDNPEAPLFVSLWKGYGSQLSEEQAYWIVKQAEKRARTGKDVSPHKFRHARLTDLVIKGINEPTLRKIAGWEDDSKMASIYVHLAGVDVDDAILKAEGIKKKKDEKIVSTLAPRICPFCKQENPFSAKWCNCGKPLDMETAIEAEDDLRAKVEMLETTVKTMQEWGKALMKRRKNSRG